MVGFACDSERDDAESAQVARPAGPACGPGGGLRFRWRVELRHDRVEDPAAAGATVGRQAIVEVRVNTDGLRQTERAASGLGRRQRHSSHPPAKSRQAPPRRARGSIARQGKMRTTELPGRRRSVSRSMSLNPTHLRAGGVVESIVLICRALPEMHSRYVTGMSRTHPRWSRCHRARHHRMMRDSVSKRRKLL